MSVTISVEFALRHDLVSVGTIERLLKHMDGREGRNPGANPKESSLTRGAFQREMTTNVASSSACFEAEIVRRLRGNLRTAFRALGRVDG